MHAQHSTMLSIDKHEAQGHSQSGFLLGWESGQTAVVTCRLWSLSSRRGNWSLAFASMGLLQSLVSDMSFSCDVKLATAHFIEDTVCFLGTYFLLSAPSCTLFTVLVIPCMWNAKLQFLSGPFQLHDLSLLPFVHSSIPKENWQWASLLWEFGILSSRNKVLLIQINCY